MLICVKEKKIPAAASQWSNGGPKKRGMKCTLKGSILIKKHLKKVGDSSGPGKENLQVSLSQGTRAQQGCLLLVIADNSRICKMC